MFGGNYWPDLIVYTVNLLSGNYAQVVFRLTCGMRHSVGPCLFVRRLFVKSGIRWNGWYNTSPSPASDTVIIKNFAFSPATLSVPAGTTVTWINDDSATHDVA